MRTVSLRFLPLQMMVSPLKRPSVSRVAGLSEATVEERVEGRTVSATDRHEAWHRSAIPSLLGRLPRCPPVPVRPVCLSPLSSAVPRPARDTQSLVSRAHAQALSRPSR